MNHQFKIILIKYHHMLMYALSYCALWVRKKPPTNAIIKKGKYLHIFKHQVFHYLISKEMGSSLSVKNNHIT